MTNSNSDRFLQSVMDECARFVGSRLVPPAIAGELTRSIDNGGLLFVDHPVALATLPLAAYEAAGGSDAQDIVPVGAAMEFLLTAGDILDDLQDGDLEFEENETHSSYVEMTETITALILLAEHAILSIDSKKISIDRILKTVRIFSDFKLRAFEGQHADAHAKDSTYTTPRQVLERTQLKSGSLGKCAGMLGSTLATNDEESINMAAEFGEHLGVIYQLKNDIFDLWPDHGHMDDASSGKATAPTAFALAVSDGEAGSSAISRLLENLRPDPHDVEQARQETFDSGGMHFAMIQSFAHLARTKTIASQLADKHGTDNLGSMLVNL